MKVFLIVVSTADGFIAKDAGHTAMMWTSMDDKKHFVELTKRAGVIVMGSTTFKTMPKPLKDRLNIVYSRNPDSIDKADNVEVTNASPAELIASLEARDYSEVAICGGSQIYTNFIKSGLVNTIYLTIEPVIFGQGINIFSEIVGSANGQKITLVNSRTTEGGTLFLEYTISPNSQDGHARAPLV